MQTPPNRITGKAWADVKTMDGKTVHTVITTASRIDKVVAGMLINMNRDAYFVDARYEFPEKGERGEDGKVRS